MKQTKNNNKKRDFFFYFKKQPFFHFFLHAPGNSATIPNPPPLLCSCNTYFKEIGPKF